MNKKITRFALAGKWLGLGDNGPAIDAAMALSCISAESASVPNPHADERSISRRLGWVLKVREFIKFVSDSHYMSGSALDVCSLCATGFASAPHLHEALAEPVAHINIRKTADECDSAHNLHSIDIQELIGRHQRTAESLPCLWPKLFRHNSTGTQRVFVTGNKTQ